MQINNIVNSSAEKDAYTAVFQSINAKGIDNGDTKAGAAVSSSSNIQDNSFQLTQRLVSAGTQFAVQQVVADAYKSLSSLLLAAANAKGKEGATIRSYIRKLEKLISRCNRKMKELGNEELMRQEHANAQRRKQHERAEEIKIELKKKLKERKIRERGYLRDAGNDDEAGANPLTDAQLSIQAAALASAEMASAAFSSPAGGEIAGPVAGASSGAATGGTPSVSDGGSPEGGVDIVV